MKRSTDAQLPSGKASRKDATKEQPPVVHYLLIYAGVDDVEARWGESVYLSLSNVLAMDTVGPIVRAMHEKAKCQSVWNVRLDLTPDTGGVIAEDTRTEFGMPITFDSNSSIQEELDDAEIVGGAWHGPPASHYIVGNLIVHNEV